jgi:hypothetical protein
MVRLCRSRNSVTRCGEGWFVAYRAIQTSVHSVYVLLLQSLRSMERTIRADIRKLTNSAVVRATLLL